jgi:hypothetical protein
MCKHVVNGYGRCNTVLSGEFTERIHSAPTERDVLRCNSVLSGNNTER